MGHLLILFVYFSSWWYGLNQFSPCFGQRMLVLLSSFGNIGGWTELDEVGHWGWVLQEMLSMAHFALFLLPVSYDGNSWLQACYTFTMMFLQIQGARELLTDWPLWNHEPNRFFTQFSYFYQYFIPMIQKWLT